MQKVIYCIFCAIRNTVYSQKESHTHKSFLYQRFFWTFHSNKQKTIDKMNDSRQTLKGENVDHFRRINDYKDPDA